MNTEQMGTVFIWMATLLRRHRGAEIHHHGYLNAWDDSFHHQASILGVKRVPHPGIGLVEVIDMVDLVIANPRTVDERVSWSWCAIARARRKRKRIIIVTPDSLWTEEP